jgi:alpha-ribazole phosphatase/probable phosphoglycerate mutase
MGVELVYETHSLSVDNQLGIATGWLPGQLSEPGRAGARKLGERRRADGIAIVFVSDLARAVETAEIAFADSGIPIRRDPRLRECNYGSMNGAPIASLSAVRSRHIDVPFPGGQSYRDVVAAMRSFLGDLATDWDGKRVVVISHSANRWALEHLLHGIPLEELVDAPFDWQEGWLYTIPTAWRSAGS